MDGESNEHEPARSQPRKRDDTNRVPTPLAPYSEMAERAARSHATILMTGETGVGKGHLARWLHERSLRSSGPFVPVNCGAIPESLIDSQLFGHAKGSFSGAAHDHPGLVRAAETGTLFFDEVGELPPSAQTRLLRLLQDREIQPVGYARPIVVDLRVIAATNGDLVEATKDRRFREDLLFRLDVVQIEILPLRERLEELPELLAAFNAEFAALYRQPALEFMPDAMDILHAYHWPGNIRQLRTVVERLHVLCPEEDVSADRLIQIGQLRDFVRGGTAPKCLKTVRHEELQRVLRNSGGSVRRAAEVFGVHRSTIYRWLRENTPSHTVSPETVAARNGS